MLDGALHRYMDSWTADVEFETMTDRFAEDVDGAVIARMPADGRSLEDTIRVTFKRETGMGPGDPGRSVVGGRADREVGRREDRGPH